MKTKNGSVCDFCGAGEVGDGYLIEHDNGVVICDQCVRAITALLKANPGRKHLRYLPKQVNKKNG